MSDAIGLLCVVTLFGLLGVGILIMLYGVRGTAELLRRIKNGQTF